MSNTSLRKAVLATLASWEKLDDAHKGSGYSESVARLVSWADELENGKTKVRQLIKVGCGVDVMQLAENQFGIDMFDDKCIDTINEVL